MVNTVYSFGKIGNLVARLKHLGTAKIWTGNLSSAIWGSKC